MLASVIGGAVNLVTTIEPDIWTIRVDANELELALVNLALNAGDAMKAGGVISITAGNAVLPKSATPAGIEGEFVAVRVSDTGSGIAPDVLPKVFDPFHHQGVEQRKRARPQVHGFAHQSGGTVTIESEVGRGTLVTIYLPRSQEPLAAALSQGEVETVTGGRVLLVEDNPEVLSVAASMLEQLGYDIEAVSDADAALGRIAEQEFDLVISDIVMPGAMDGTALANVVRARKSELPVLLMTGYSPAAACPDSVFAVIRKPFQLSDLSVVVTRLIAEAKQPSDSNVVRLRDARPVPTHEKNR
jgi:CheY-like chemotaxis protein